MQAGIRHVTFLFKTSIWGNAPSPGKVVGEWKVPMAYVCM